MLGVHQRQDRVEQKGLGNLIVHEEGLRHRTWVGQARGFDHDAVKAEQTFAALGRQQLQGHAQVFADGAADATVTHLDDLLIGVRDQNVVVDVLFTELVLDHGDLLTMGLGQHALEQGGFARAQKAGQDGGGDQGHGAIPVQDKKTRLRSVAMNSSAAPAHRAWPHPAAAQPAADFICVWRGGGLRRRFWPSAENPAVCRPGWC